MRNIYILMLLLTGLTGFAFSPPVIQQPSDINTCDGFTVDLTVQNPTILGALNPALYTVMYHFTAADAEANVNPIQNPTSFIANNSQVIFVRVEDNANPTDYAITAFSILIHPITTATISTPDGTVCGNGYVTFQAIGGASPYTFTYQTNAGAPLTVTTTGENFVNIPLLTAGVYDIMLISVQSSSMLNCYQIADNYVHIEVTPGPDAGEPQDIIIPQDPYVGTAVFDLTINSVILTSGAGTTVSYYTTATDAELGTLGIVNPAAFTANDGQIIWARVQNAEGCYVLKSFGLYLTNPNIVFIPDANFKNILVIADGANQVAQDLAHNFTVVDANGDGQIQYSEAANISLLNIGQRNIADLTGLEAFPNVAWLNVGYNPALTAIPTTALPLLQDLSASHCQLETLDLSNNPLLYSVSLEYNSLDALDLSACPLLTSAHCQNNQLTTLNLTNLTLLTDLVASNNQITTINTDDLDSIITLNVAANALTSLNAAGHSTMQTLICEENQIDSIDTTGCTNLTNLRCAANQMTYLDVSGSTALSNLDCSLNTLLNLDLGSNASLCSLNCTWNNALVTINIKNGVDTCYTNFNFWGTNGALQQFCCDDNEVAYFKNYYLTNMSADVNVSSYCSFTPGGDYNTITANIQYDSDNNGCDVNDGGFPNVRLNINDNTNQGASFTNPNGGGFFYTQAGTFTITPSVENPTWFTISPPNAVIPFSNTNNNTANQSFCIAPNGIHPDLEIVVAPLTSARPGFDAYYNIVFKNKGNQTLSQVGNGVVFAYDNNRMTLIDSSLPVASSTAGTLNWDLTALEPFESRSIMLRMHVNPPTDPNFPVNIGHVFTFDVTVNPVAGDENPGDNAFQLHQTVIGSYDPNEIVCLEGNIVSPIEIGNYLHYTINFENTGNADAENIVVREVIDTTQFDVSSLQLLDSSASVTTRLMGNTAEFIFPSINLHSGGHGNILLKIRSNNTLNEGDTVSKRANIYFDYNYPVETEPENTVFQSLSNPDIPIDASISVYPNPTKGNVYIGCNTMIKSVQLYDIQGRLLQTNLVNQDQAALDMSGQSKGVYFVKVLSDNGILVQKIIRE